MSEQEHLNVVQANYEAFNTHVCWLRIISVHFIRPLRALSHVSRSLPIPQRKSTIEMLLSAHLQKG